MKHCFVILFMLLICFKGISQNSDFYFIPDTISNKISLAYGVGEIDQSALDLTFYRMSFSRIGRNSLRKFSLYYSYARRDRYDVLREKNWFALEYFTSYKKITRGIFGFDAGLFLMIDYDRGRIEQCDNFKTIKIDNVFRLRLGPKLQFSLMDRRRFNLAFVVQLDLTAFNYERNNFTLIEPIHGRSVSFKDSSYLSSKPTIGLMHLEFSIPLKKD